MAESRVRVRRAEAFNLEGNAKHVSQPPRGISIMPPRRRRYGSDETGRCAGGGARPSEPHDERDGGRGLGPRQCLEEDALDRECKAAASQGVTERDKEKGRNKDHDLTTQRFQMWRRPGGRLRRRLRSRSAARGPEVSRTAPEAWPLGGSCPSGVRGDSRAPAHRFGQAVLPKILLLVRSGEKS